MHGLLCDARKLTHVAYLRRDQLVPELSGIATRGQLSRLLLLFGNLGAGFTSAAAH